MGDIISLPFAALLRWMYSFTGNYGLSIILFAVVVKLVILPFQMKSKRGMVRMGRLSGRQAELQKQYANNQQKYQEELSKLYQEEGVNPMGGCLWSLLPMFIIIPLYSIIYRPITHFMRLGDDGLEKVRAMAEALGYDASKYSANYEQIGLTDFISKHWNDVQAYIGEHGGEGMEGLLNVDFTFLGLDLSTQPQVVFGEFSWGWTCIGVLLIPFIATGLQYLSSIIMAKSNGQSEEQRKQMRTMNLLMPLMSLYFCFIMPAAMGVYWIVNTILSTLQEFLLGKFYTKKLNREEDEREAARAAARAARMEEAKLRAAEQREQGERKKIQPKKDENRAPTTEAGRVDDRPYARGRSYQADRYDDKE